MINDIMNTIWRWNMRLIKDALVFDNVLLEPCYSEILPSFTNTQTRWIIQLFIDIL